MESKRAKCRSNFYMLMVKNAYEGSIDFRGNFQTSCLVVTSLLLIFQEVSPVCKILASVRARRIPDVSSSELSAFEGNGICYCCNDSQPRVLQCPGVGVASTASADHQESRVVDRAFIGLFAKKGGHVFNMSRKVQ
jgi:hypothetical protein